MALVTAVIPNHSRRNLLDSLLRDLRHQSRPPDEVVVIDNGSHDDSVALARSHGARVVEMGHNAGFSRAVNRGIREARGDCVAILNNDVTLNVQWLDLLCRALDDSSIWFAAGKIYRSDSVQTIDGTHDEISRAACPWRCGEGREDGPLWSTPRGISFAPLTAVVIRKQLFEHVGMLDEDYGSYLEDVDFGLRCAIGEFAGRYVPAAIAYHKGSATLGMWNSEKVRLLSRNQLLLVAKHYPPRWWATLGWPVVVGQLLWGLVAARHGAGLAYLRGKFDGLRRFRGVRSRARRSTEILRVLAESEARIRYLQQASGYDWFWRIYFALT